MNTPVIYTTPASAGRGSAGQCPASGIAKTPAAREQVSRVAGEKDTACASVCGGEVAR